MWITSFSALGIMKYYIESTKTTSGTRKIPMTEEVKELCQRIVANRNKPKRESIIDGYGGFLFFGIFASIALNLDNEMQGIILAIIH